MTEKFMTEKIPLIRKILFYLALAIEIALVIVDKSELQNPYVSYFFRLTFLLTLMVVFLSNYTRREWIVIAIFCVISVISYRISGRNDMLRFVFFVFACKHMNLEKTLRFSFLATLTGCILIAVLSVLGIFGAISLTQDFGRSAGVITRYTFGFGHPNAMQCMFIMLMLLGMYLYDRKMKWYGYIILMIFNYVIYDLTDSRTGFLVAAGAILLAALLHYTRLRDHMWVYTCGIAIMGMCIAFSIWAAAESLYSWCDWTMVSKINGILNGRIVQLYWGTNAHEGALQTWRLFSSRTSQAYFDMGWVRLFYWYGWIPALIVIGLLVLLLIECGRRHDGEAMMLIVSMSLYTVLEAHLVSGYIGRNYLLLIFGAYGFSMLHADQGTEWGLMQRFLSATGSKKDESEK